MRYLVTGAAGFIGYHTAERLLARGSGAEVVGVDNVNDYYDPALKRARLARLEGKPGFSFRKLDLADTDATLALFAETRPDIVIHLAAQPGVRYSLTHPHAYAQANLVAFLSVLEGCRHHGVKHLAYASSSSVYGDGSRMPFRVQDPVDHPVSLYAATKKANELMAHTYSHLYGLPTTGLRFFTVYGPWGRPDMAYFLFTKAVLEGRPIEVFNNGEMARDFTYIDDIVEGVVRAADSPAGYKLYNIGAGRPVKLLDMIAAVERATGKQAVKKFMPMQPGDVTATWADVDDLVRDFDYRPNTPIDVGIRKFVEWYRDYYRA